MISKRITLGSKSTKENWTSFNSQEEIEVIG